MTDQPRWPRGTPGGGHAPGPGPGRFRPEGDWASRVSARLPGGGIRGMVPDDASPYGETKPDAVRDWARSELEYEQPVDDDGEPTTVRSTVESYYATRHRNDTRSVTISGVFRLPPDGYYKQGKEIGNWSFHVTANPSGDAHAEIDGIGIRWEWRGQGIARRWLQQLERAMQGQGVPRVELFDLSTAGDPQSRGRSYWRQHGFRHDGDRWYVKDL